MKIVQTAGRIGAGLLVLMYSVAFAQEIREEAIALEKPGELVLVEGSIEAGEILDFSVSGERSQILSVDLQASTPSLNFNIMPAGDMEALFIGSTLGTVADVPLPETGDYVIRVYLMGAAGVRGKATFSLGVSLGAPEFADSLAGGPDWWQVSGLEGGEPLNLREGPSTRYGVTGKLSNGEIVQNRGCRMTGDARWCNIRAAHSGAMGWVAGRFLIESGAPAQAQVPEGGPVGNGTPFDATGSVPCSDSSDGPLSQCPFGVIRQGPGNAGVWIVLPSGEERQILFEGNAPVATSGKGAMNFEMKSDYFHVSIGEEHFEVPSAVVNGG